MPAGSTVKIFTVSARWVATLTADAGGKAPWNLTNDSGARSAKAVGILGKIGFKRLRNLKGGILAWSKDVDPSVPQY